MENPSYLSSLDSTNDIITLAEAKFLLQKCEQRLNENALFSNDLQLHGGTTNIANGTNFANDRGGNYV